MNILDNPLITNILFYPRKTSKPRNLPDNIEVMEFKISDNVNIGGLFFSNDIRLPNLLFFHGNGEIASDYLHMYTRFIELGVNFAVVDFRGYGFSTAQPDYSSLIADSLPIYEQFQLWLIENGYSERIFLMGRSLGSACVSEIGASNPNGLIGIIYESGFASVYHLMKKLMRVGLDNISEEMVYEWSNEIRIKKINQPVLIMHGVDDELIPFSEAKLIEKSLDSKNESKLIAIKGAGHNNMMMFEEEYFGSLKVFISNYS